MSQTALSTGPRRVLVFGASGQLGAPLLRELSRELVDVRSVRWSEISGLGAEALRQRLERELEGASGCDVVFASGLTDPKLPGEALFFSNFEFPKRVMDALAGRQLRFLTLGTIMERFPEACLKNPYLNSKKALGEWMQAQGSADFLHVRLHTVYGGAPKKHMFLGQMAHAMLAGAVFEMSSGEQLREYHHAEDIAVSLAGILGRRWESADLKQPGSLLEIHSGKPLRLADLARGVFGAFGKLSLLKIGAIAGAQGDNTSRVFERSPSWLLPRSREPLAGVVESLRESMGRLG